MDSRNCDANDDTDKSCRQSLKQETAPAVHFDDLAQGQNEVVIEFENQHYRLRVTRNGKLILNK